jgi:hypothetical protein
MLGDFEENKSLVDEFEENKDKDGDSEECKENSFNLEKKSLFKGIKGRHSKE